SSRQQRIAAMVPRGGEDPIVVGRDPGGGGAAFPRTLGYPHDHRLAGDVGERLARQAGRGVARRNQDRGAEEPRPWRGAPLRRYSISSAGSSLRASSSSITGMPSRIG